MKRSKFKALEKINATPRLWEAILQLQIQTSL